MIGVGVLVGIFFGLGILFKQSLAVDRGDAATHDRKSEAARKSRVEPAYVVDCGPDRGHATLHRAEEVPRTAEPQEVIRAGLLKSVRRSDDIFISDETRPGARRFAVVREGRTVMAGDMWQVDLGWTYTNIQLCRELLEPI